MGRVKTAVFLFLTLLVLSGPAQCAGAADYYNAGLNSYKHGDYKKAIQFFNYAVKLDNRNAVYYKAIGFCYQKCEFRSKGPLFSFEKDQLFHSKGPLTLPSLIQCG